MYPETHIKQRPYAVAVGPVVPKFDIVGDIDNATMSSLYFGGFKEIVNQGIGMVLKRFKTHTLVLFPKYVPTAPYEQMATLIRNHEGIPIVTTIDQISADTLFDTLITMNKIRLAMEEVARTNKDEISHTYIYQHLGPDDVLPKKPYNPSYAPLHLHVSAYGSHFDRFSSFSATERINMRSREYRHFDRDPIIIVVRDLFQKIFKNEFPDAHQKGQSAAIILSTTDINSPITRDEVVVLQRVIKEWKKHLREVQSCYTDFQQDANGRPVPYPVEQRLENLDKLFSRVPYDSLTESSKHMLVSIARLLKPSDQVDEWSWFYRGIAGSFAFEFDWTNRTRSLILSPRITTSKSSWHYPAMTPAVVRVRNKGKEPGPNDLDPRAIAELYPIFQAIISNYNKMQ
jgi:hypothetical protein